MILLMKQIFKNKMKKNKILHDKLLNIIKVLRNKRVLWIKKI